MAFFKKFSNRFTLANVKKHYYENFEYFGKVGIDRVNSDNFNKNIDEYCRIISRKVLDGTYNFIPYKQVLIQKGKNKFPREISIPSIRDSVVLSILKDIMHEEFDGLLKMEYIKKKIIRVQKEFRSDKYNYMIKIDMKNFYGSLDHDILIKKLWKKIRKKEFKKILLKAISKQTIAMNQHQSTVDENKRGVPQGLPISNVLADIYMIDFDRKHASSSDYSYFRYVDDILVFCARQNVESIYKSLINELKNDLNLKPHKKGKNEKTCVKKIDETFEYLGYRFVDDLITVRESSINKLEQRLERLFNNHSNKYIDYRNFIWNLNLRITGVVYNGKNYGWVFYFSQINDETLMFRLDNLVKKFSKRYGLYNHMYKGNEKYNIKRFVRVYHEIKKNLRNTSYIPKLNDITDDEKKEILDINEIKYDPENQSEVNLKYDKLMLEKTNTLSEDRDSIS